MYKMAYESVKWNQSHFGRHCQVYVDKDGIPNVENDMLSPADSINDPSTGKLKLLFVSVCMCEWVRACMSG